MFDYLGARQMILTLLLRALISVVALMFALVSAYAGALIEMRLKLGS
jgi:hypothetical protein